MRSQPLVLAMLFLALLPACGGGSSPVAEIVVTTLADAGPGSLRAAVEAAPPGARITFDPTLAGGTIELLSRILISNPIEIDGGADPIVIDGGDATRHFQINFTSARLTSLVLQEGFATTNGGSIRALDSELFLQNVQFIGCDSDDRGGGIHAGGCTIDMTRCHFLGCTGTVGGACNIRESNTSIRACSFFLNAALGGSAGALRFTHGQAVVQNSTLHGNAVVGSGSPDGGALAASAVDLLAVTSCTITGNTAGASGGGIKIFGDIDHEARLRHNVVAQNVAPDERDLSIASGVQVTSHHNFVGALEGGPVLNGIDGNFVGTYAAPLDPELGGLEFAPGQITASRQPLAGSPTLDRVPHDECLDVNDQPLDRDQRGADRFADAAADIGAVER